MSEIREEDGSVDRKPQASASGDVAGDTEEPKPQREPPGDEQQQEPKHKGKKKKIFKRAQALLGSSIKRISISRKSSSSPCSESPCCPSSKSYPVYFGDEPIGCCYLCFLPPLAVDSPQGPGRPSGNTSSYGFVKSLIERNDFYDPECNVHRDV